MAFKDWSETAANNDDADAGINWAEGQAPSTVNGSARSMMAVLKKALGHIVSVKDYGAVGDASTDDATSIQAAIDAVEVAGGGTVFFPESTYIVGSTITVPSNIELRGVGWTSVVKLEDAANVAVIANDDQAGGNSYIILRDLKIDGNKANQSGGTVVSGINFENVDDFVIENVWVADTRESGIFIHTGNRFKLERCHVTGVEQSTHVGIYLGYDADSGSVTDGQVVNCYTASNGQDGILMQAGSGVQIIGCVSKSNGQSGVKFGNAARSQIIGCYAEGNTTGFRGQGHDQCTFSGNIAYRNNDSGMFIGVQDVTSTDTIIANNQCIENGQDPTSTSYGINIDYSGGSSTGSIDGLYIHNNVCVDRQGSPTQTRGISIGASAGTYTNIVLTGNFCKGNSSTDYFRGAAVSNYAIYKQGNVGFTGSASFFALDPLSVTRLRFWADNIPAAAGTTHMNEMATGNGGRGFVVPRNGWIRFIYGKANAALSAGSITIITRVNNSNVSPNITLDTSNQSNSSSVTFPGTQVAQGDYIQCIYNSHSSLSPTTLELDVTIELVC